MKYFLILVGIILLAGAVVYFVMANKEDPKQASAQPVAEVPTQPVTPVVPDTSVDTVTLIKPTTPAEPTVDKAVVTINGVPIMESQVIAKIDKAMKERMAQMPATMNIPPEALKGFRDSMRTRVVDVMVLEFLIDEGLKAKKIEITEQDVGAEIERMNTLRKSTLDELKAEIAKQGMTLSQLKDQLKGLLKQKRLIEMEMEAAGESTEVTEEDAKKFYDENKAQFSSPEQVRASHILISTKELDDAGKVEAKKKIDDLLKRARAGEDFGELANQYSEDPGSKDKGGEYTFPRGDMVPPFEQAAFSLEVDQISDVVTTIHGYHIIKLSEKIPAKSPSFDEMKERILIYMADVKKRKFWPKVNDKLRSEAKIEWSAEEEARRSKPATPPMTRPPIQVRPPAQTRPPEQTQPPTE